MNWKKIGKTLKGIDKKWQKAGGWVSRNINPDVLGGDYGLGGGMDFDVRPPSIFDEMGGGSARRRTSHRHKRTSGKKSSSRGKSITIRFD